MGRKSNMKTPQKIGPVDKDFVLDDFIFYNLNRASVVYNDEMSKALASRGLNTMKWRILMLLADKSPSTVSELSRRSVTKMPTLTRMLIRMEEEGLVVRTAPDDDRRFVDVTMTAKAVKTLREVKSIGQRVFERAFAGTSAEELAVATSVLKRMRENLQSSPYEQRTVNNRNRSA